MKQNVFTESEIAYMNQFQPAGFLRTWEALYRTKCIAGPWTFSRRRMVFGSFERGNMRPSMGRTVFDYGRIIGWHVRIPLGFCTASLWGYVRREAGR